MGPVPRPPSYDTESIQQLPHRTGELEGAGLRTACNGAFGLCSRTAVNAQTGVCTPAGGLITGRCPAFTQGLHCCFPCHSKGHLWARPSPGFYILFSSPV